MERMRDASCAFEGIGLHTGSPCRVTLRRTAERPGVVIRRIDLPGSPEIIVAAADVKESTRRTVLGQGDVSISTTEHVLAALFGMGHHRATIEVDGPEIPILDGSALPFAEDLVHWPPPSSPEPLEIKNTVTVSGKGESRAIARPSTRFSIDVQIDFEHAAIGRQRVTWDGSPESFLADFAPARTFGFLDELAELERLGLAAGGSLDCALVFGKSGPLNGPRFPDEPARHKLVDALGDLALLGGPIRAKIELVRPGHSLMSRLLRGLREGLRRR